jgi:hypothetical protein
VNIPPSAWATGVGPEAWTRANRELLAKLITELAFEDVLEPEPLGEDRFRLDLGGAGVITYRARERHLGHRRVDAGSLSLRGGPGADDRQLPDVPELLGRAAPVLGLDPAVAAGLIGELHSTLLSDAWQLTRGRPVDELVDARLKRAEILSTTERPLVWFVLDELVIRRPIGGVDVMREQLDYLLTLTNAHKIRVQVIPETCVTHPGLAGPFRTMAFADLPPVAYPEHTMGGVILDAEDSVRRCSVIFSALQAEALPPGESAELIRTRRKQL